VRWESNIDRQIRRCGPASLWNQGFTGCILICMADVTQILSRIEDGDPSAAEQLLPVDAYHK
jgi:hypothetical protein